MNLNFKQWLKLNEVGTGSADIAAFARPMMAPIRREFPTIGGKTKNKNEKRRNFKNVF